MGEMSSMVSSKPPPSGSTSQANDFFWMSIRLGTSIDLSRRANVRRVRGASTEAKTATPRGGRERAGEVRWTCRRHTGATSQDSTGVGGPPGEGRSALTDPARPGSRMWREGHCGRLRLSAGGPQGREDVNALGGSGRRGGLRIATTSIPGKPLPDVMDTRLPMRGNGDYHVRGMVGHPGVP